MVADQLKTKVDWPLLAWLEFREQIHALRRARMCLISVRWECRSGARAPGILIGRAGPGARGIHAVGWLDKQRRGWRRRLRQQRQRRAPTIAFDCF